MANEVWIYAEHKDGKLKKSALELLSGARSLANDLGTQLVAVTLGCGLEAMVKELGAYGADKVIIAENEALKNYLAVAYAQTLAGLAQQHQPAILLGPASAQGKDLFPRVAAKLGTGMASDCIKIQLDGQKLLSPVRPMYAGKAMVEANIPEARPQMATVRPNVLAVAPKQEGKQAQIEKVAVDAPKDLKTVLKEIIKGAKETVDLTEATIIISGGRAMKAADNFKILWDLAEVFGSGTTVGASRAAVDSGFAPTDMQVGQTGKVVNPTLYIACGISGAIQHLAGMRTSKFIVAINKDADAPIFQKADYGIVGDLFKVVPVLTEEVKKLKAQD